MSFRQTTRRGELRGRKQVDSNRKSSSTRTADGFSINSVHLSVTGKIPGIDQAAFQSIAAKAEAGCPVSTLMKIEIGFEATLLS